MAAKQAAASAWAPPYYPIVYVRGYAMTAGERDETTADPFCGFNLGSTVYRAVADQGREPRKYVFESPVVRLMSFFGYRDVYEDGQDILDPGWETAADGQPTQHRMGSRAIVIHRYYDSGSTLFGNGKAPSIEESAAKLSALIERVRTLVCGNPENAVRNRDFKCYLVAHSMGGLVCRAFLQNPDPKLDPKGVRGCVDKLFTYATPHNGIDVLGINVPSWLTKFDVSNFDRDKRMPEYLGLRGISEKHDGRVDLLPESRFPSRKVFCMVGTNRSDYDAARGLSRTFVGDGSDGLVKIQNATLCGLNDDGSLGERCATAYAFRSHSGFYGIVNSEEAFQNMVRFLFGDVRADVWLDIDEVRLPAALQRAVDEGREVEGLYQIEVIASPRGKLWYLTRRTAEEDSVACIRHTRWKQETPHYLSSVFLAKEGRVDKGDPSMSYALTLGVRVPDYEVERKLWINDHYEGGYLFRNTVVLKIVPPQKAGDAWHVEYAWQDAGVAKADTQVDPEELRHGKVEVSIPFNSYSVEPGGGTSSTRPGIKGKLRFVISTWNQGE